VGARMRSTLTHESYRDWERQRLRRWRMCWETSRRMEGEVEMSLAL
jgi:hypothetical protein